jgi:hypothetical protein
LYKTTVLGLKLSTKSTHFSWPGRYKAKKHGGTHAIQSTQLMTQKTLELLPNAEKKTLLFHIPKLLVV